MSETSPTGDTEGYLKRLEDAVTNLLVNHPLMDSCECDHSVDRECPQCALRRVLAQSPLARAPEPDQP